MDSIVDSSGIVDEKMLQVTLRKKAVGRGHEAEYKQI